MRHRRGSIAARETVPNRGGQLFNRETPLRVLVVLAGQPVDDLILDVVGAGQSDPERDVVVDRLCVDCAPGG